MDVSGVSECQGEEERCVILPTHSESSRVARGKKRREEGIGKGQSKAKQSKGRLRERGASWNRIGFEGCVDRMVGVDG